ncbi:MAG TPA: cysteine dioxygenase family protein [Planctomycetota bacterium]|jgi:predicted metal-dependent enzyme (double-stranded beta helix superfamily)|nr:cysteine dioxygenase family protein [Planctomycetota bacterium]
MAGRITLDQFIFEMMHVPPPQLTLEGLKELFGRLDLREALVHEHVHFTPDAYARNLLCRTPRFDMLVLCWRPGNVTTIHDHAGSLNVTRVFDGSLTSRRFEESARPGPGRVLVRQAAEDRLGRNDYACVDYDEIHQLANTSDHDLVTVHVYAKPLKDINVYCPTTGEVEKLTLRYTLEDEFA